VGELRAPGGREARGDAALESFEDALGDGPERARARAQVDANRTLILLVATTADELVPLHESDERRDRLLAQACPARELAHAEAVLVEEREQDGSVRRTHLRVSRCDELRVEKLVPALRGLGQQIAEVLARCP
jgi:hypothetical protein